MKTKTFVVSLCILTLIVCVQDAVAQPVSPGASLPSDLPPQTNMTNAPRDLVTNPKTSVTLGDLNGWIWISHQGTQSAWHKLIPGMFPQWAPDGKRFYYFLGVGFDGWRSELWSARPDGEDRLLASSASFWIVRTPIFSPDSTRLAYYYQTCMASGDFNDILVIDLRLPNRPAQVVYRSHSDIDPDSLQWKNPATLEVRINRAWTTVDAASALGSQSP